MKSSGAGTVAAAVTPIRAADASGNLFFEVSITGTMSGTFNGTFSEKAREVLHPDGSVNAEGTGTFMGTVAGCGARTFVFGVEARGMVTSVSGRFGTIDDAAASAPIHTENFFSQPTPATFVYSGVYTC